MFRKSNEELALIGLEDFIEKPSQDCSEEELKNGVSKVSIVLGKNPAAIMNIIVNHSCIDATFLFDDLVDKMKKQNCLNKLGTLFDKCLDELVEECICNLYDLDRCLDALPEHSSKVIQNILSHEHRCKRILNADKNPEETLNKISTKYPDYKNKFSEFYNQHFNLTTRNKI